MSHQSELMARLTSRINEVKRTQDEGHVALLQVPREHEAPPAGIKSLAELPVDSNGNPICSLSTVIHCAFLEKPEQRFTVEELHGALSNQFPGLASNASEFQVRDTYYLPPFSLDDKTRPPFPVNSRDQEYSITPAMVV
jgi:hypothetical protein